MESVAHSHTGQDNRTAGESRVVSGGITTQPNRQPPVRDLAGRVLCTKGVPGWYPCCTRWQLSSSACWPLDGA